MYPAAPEFSPLDKIPPTVFGQGDFLSGAGTPQVLLGVIRSNPTGKMPAELLPGPGSTEPGRASTALRNPARLMTDYRKGP